MSNWFNVYHQALLVRLAGLALIFGVLWPGLWLLFSMACQAGTALPPRDWTERAATTGSPMIDPRKTNGAVRYGFTNDTSYPPYHARQVCFRSSNNVDAVEIGTHREQAAELTGQSSEDGRPTTMASQYDGSGNCRAPS